MVCMIIEDNTEQKCMHDIHNSLSYTRTAHGNKNLRTPTTIAPTPTQDKAKKEYPMMFLRTTHCFITFASLTLGKGTSGMGFPETVVICKGV